MGGFGPITTTQGMNNSDNFPTLLKSRRNEGCCYQMGNQRVACDDDVSARY